MCSQKLQVVNRLFLKLLSEDPANYPDAPREGIRRILEKVDVQDVIIIVQNLLINLYLCLNRCINNDNYLFIDL